MMVKAHANTWKLRAGAAMLVAVSQGACSAAPDPRSAMVAEIRENALKDYPGWPDEPPFRAALSALARIDRAAFVTADQRLYAYRTTPLPIGSGQTISSPYVVAIMTAAAEVRPGSNVLEIGTGSGYQAAVLARLGARVRSVEIVPDLARTAERRLRRLGIGGVRIRIGDGFAGWHDYAPYDAIIVTAGAAMVPAPLLDQLKPGGKLVMPVGKSPLVEQLVVVTRQVDGSLSSCSLGPTNFVPLTGKGRTPPVAGPYNSGIALCRKGQTARWPGQPPG